MKLWGLLVVTAATFLLTGIVLQQSGWFDHSRTAPVIRSAPREALSSAAAMKHARSSPNHWRDCLLAY